MQFNQFSAKIDARSQTIWIEDQAPCFVGPDLDPYCLQRSSMINIVLYETANKIILILFKNFWRALYRVSPIRTIPNSK